MYLFVKVLTHFTLWLFCKRISLYNRASAQVETPMVLGCNHPNSFLDAIVIGAQMKNRVHFISRSDVFKKAWVRAILKSVNMIPIYRMRDGKHNLSKNDETFEITREILQRGEHVLIFVEGFCKYQTTLQLPLKKGAPRMLVQGWQDGVDLKLLPVWVRYSSFFDFPKEIDINFGTPFGKEILKGHEENGAAMFVINKQTEIQLQFLSGIKNPQRPVLNKAILFVPAMLAVITHVLFYMPLQQLAWKFRGAQFYDSILFCLIAFLYPVYMLLVAFIFYSVLGIWGGLAALVGLPLLAKAYVMWK